MTASLSPSVISAALMTYSKRLHHVRMLIVLYNVSYCTQG